MKLLKNLLQRNMLFVLGFLVISSDVFCQNDQYEVYALKYKSGGKIPATGIAVGALNGDSVRVCNMFWFLKGKNGRNILVDAGDTDSSGPGARSFVRPDLLLNEIGIKPADITDIIITHPHFDHINGLRLFHSGKVWMQKKDFDDFVVGAWQRNNPAGFRKDDVRNLIEVSLNGRLNLVDGDNIELMPGVRAFTGSSHTRENQYLLVNSVSQNKILLASDAIWFYYNFEHMLPVVTYVIDPEAYVKAMKRMKTLVTDEKYIIPGHDDLIFSKFRGVNKNIIRIE
jgi:glyoxylase-like metal-dependent hydrolase (beta-lactamase superfamily II)